MSASESSSCKVVCPACWHSLRAKAEVIGKPVACPSCGSRFTAEPFAPPANDSQTESAPLDPPSTSSPPGPGEPQPSAPHPLNRPLKPLAPICPPPSPFTVVPTVVIIVLLLPISCLACWNLFSTVRERMDLARMRVLQFNWKELKSEELRLFPLSEVTKDIGLESELRSRQADLRGVEWELQNIEDDQDSGEIANAKRDANAFAIAKQNEKKHLLETIKQIEQAIVERDQMQAKRVAEQIEFRKKYSPIKEEMQAIRQRNPNCLTLVLKQQID